MRNKITVGVILDEGAFMPTMAHEDDSGFDLRLPSSCGDIMLLPNQTYVVDTGVHLEIPKGYTVFIKSKSGLNMKYSILSEGVIDSGYTGSIVVKMYNNGSHFVPFKPGDKLTQIVFLPIPLVTFEERKSFKSTERGDNGFGSTGR